VIWLPQFGVEIRDCPKVLSTSLKSMAFRLENGRDFEPLTRRGQTLGIHQMYPTKAKRQEDAPPPARYRIAFVRDPVERFASFYRNRIIERKAKEAHQWDRLEGTTLTRQPSPAKLIDRLEEYRRIVPTIRHHTEKQATFLGAHAGYYDYIFNSRQVSDFEELMSELTGSIVRLPHEQRGPSCSVEIGEDEVLRLREWYRVDYEVYGPWF